MRRHWLAIGCAVLAGSFSLTRFAAATQTTEDVIDLSFSNVTAPISSAYVALFSINGDLADFDGYAPLQNIPAGAGPFKQQIVYAPASVSQTVPTDVPSPGLFGIAGVYTSGTGDATVQGLTVGIDSDEATGLEGESYTEAFPSDAPPESEVVAFLQNPNLSILPESLQAYVDGFAGQIEPALISTDDGTGDLLNFSDASISGTVTGTIGNIIISTPPTGGGTSGVPLPRANWTGFAGLTGLAGFAGIRRMRARRALN
jgi:hypothetical protein